MDYQKPKEKIDQRAARAWRVTGVVYLVFFLLLTLAFYILSNFFGPFPRWIGYSLGGLTVVVGVFAVGIIPAIRMRYWCYEIREHEVDIQYGIIVIRRSLVPMARIQHVDTEQGPILRHFKLATLSISTAGTTHKIPALKMTRALELRDLISSLARVSDEDV
ncbi:PH domain-containing protein [Isachenkonia alkalipeptolytica]|uniref:YdbS-like PH domain-containing protein n=1 Tax=Isachenkonia alkalipeptolytica TaxID=2565777 RepID=A0AA43XMH5_9CLOT|nr:PH domain-containing protein [Isachenkonia alkalipeptolytica]NBG88670.1 hypothetical protein [Isachenkonia alkalipeptolytica]